MLRRLIWTGLCLLLIGALVLLSLYRAASRVPEWYTPTEPTAATQQADTTLDKLIEVQNWASSHHAYDAAKSAGYEPQVPEIDNRLTIRFTQDELNSFLTRWYNLYARQYFNGKRLGSALRRPMLRIEPSGLIIAATIPAAGNRVVSLEIQPLVSEDRLELRIKTIRSGDLPLPDFTWSKSRDQLIVSMENLSQALRPAAALDPAGAANIEAVSVVLAQQAMDALRHQPGANVLFLPIVSEKAGLPVRLESLELQSGSITLVTRPLTQAQRETLLANIREP